MSAPPQDIAYQEAHAHEAIGYQLIIPVAIWLAMALVTLAMRLYARSSSKVGFGADDYLLIGATFFGTALSIATFIEVSYGVGRHLLTLSPDDLVMIGKLSFVVELTYTPTLALAKLGLCALYLRIFSQAGRWFAWAMYATIVWICLWMIGTYLGTFLPCVPASSIWTANCTPSQTLTLSTGITNIISDFTLLLFPQFIIWRLQMVLRKKLLVSALLALGIFATTISIARIPLIEASANSGVADITFGLVVTDVLTVLEPLTVIICANVPPAQSLWMRFVGSGFSITGILSVLRGRRSTHDVSELEMGRRWDQMQSTGNASYTQTYVRGQQGLDSSTEGIIRTDNMDVTRY